jgi:hypothetical protein
MWWRAHTHCGPAWTLHSVDSRLRVLPQANYSYGTPLSKIPSLPIGYGDAEPFLRALGGAALPNGTPSLILPTCKLI